MSTATRISPVLFRRAFDRFKAINAGEDGYEFQGFDNRESYVFKGEGYKNSIPDRALAELEIPKWKKASIGTGQILESVINAIELSGNNLLAWEGRHGPDSRVHLKIITAATDPEKCIELESLFFDLYKNRKTNQATFNGLISACGRRYELLGYLFFIISPDHFLPIRTKSFDKAIAELGVDFQTEGECSWENYQKFLAIIGDVRSCLHAEGISNATLLDAHTFCWILARYESDPPNGPIQQDIQFIPFNGTFITPILDKVITPKAASEIHDMQAESEKRRANGQIAEEFAIKVERDRLRDEGCSDLAERVEDVSNQPGYGFDIKSFDSDGKERCIEVKNISNGNRFFLSEWEWANSKTRPNYWFYLVGGIGPDKAIVQYLSADSLNADQLKPTQ